MRIVFVFGLISLLARPSWTQSNWAPAGMPFEGAQIRCLYTDTITDALWVGGDIRDGIPNNQVLLKYDGTTWTSYGYFDNQILAITRFQDKIIVGGFFTEYNETDCSKIAYLEGDEFLPLGEGANGTVVGLEVIEGTLYVCGNFENIGGIESDIIAKYDGQNWYPLAGFPELNEYNSASDIIKFGNDFFVGGNYDPLAWENTGESDIFYGQGENWQPAGSGISGSISDVRSMVDYQGELLIGGAIYQSAGNAGHSIQKWNGSTWEELGGSITGEGFSNSMFTPVEDMDVYNDLLFISGKFQCAGDIESEYITVWDGEKYCSLSGYFHGYGGGGQQEFFHDTLYMACRDSVDGQFVNNLAKYVGNWEFESCSTVSVNEQASDELGLQLFPNPASSSFNISSNKEIKSVCFFDVTGNRAIEKSVDGKSALVEVSALCKGLYLLQVVLEDGSVVMEKVVVE